MREENIVFEEGNLDDLADICLTNYDIFNGMYAAEPYSLETYEQKVKGKDLFVNLVKNDRKIIGDSIVFVESGELYLWMFGITKEYRRKGLGEKLLSINEEYAKEQGLAHLKVKVYQVSNEMISLLNKKGYFIEKIDKDAVDGKQDVIYFNKYIK